MALVIALAGRSGVGKTTAVEELYRIGVGEKFYLGEAVIADVRSRGLSPGPESEQLVRSDLRRQLGHGAFALRAAPSLKECLARGVNVLVDAVFTLEEYEVLKRTCDNSSTVVLIAVEASFETRIGRLLKRVERPLTREQLKARDDFENSALHIGSVIDSAHWRIANEGTKEDFLIEVARLCKGLGSAGN
jgi:dephospho-CoA kinase